MAKKIKNYSKTTLKTTLFLQKFSFLNEIILDHKSFYFYTEKIIVSIRFFEKKAKQSSLWQKVANFDDLKNLRSITITRNKIAY